MYLRVIGPLDYECIAHDENVERKHVTFENKMSKCSGQEKKKARLEVNKTSNSDTRLVARGASDPCQRSNAPMCAFAMPAATLYIPADKCQGSSNRN